MHHYCGTAKSTRLKYLQEGNIRYKKYVYALRPLLACRYIEENHRIPPVRFEELLKQDLPCDLSVAINEMLAIKARTDEKDYNPKVPVIQEFVDSEIDRYEKLAAEMEDDRMTDWELLNKIFVERVGEGKWYMQ